MIRTLRINFDEITEPGGRSFRFDTSSAEKKDFVIRYAGQVRAYINRCPHTGVSLDWSDEAFFDFEQKFIQCSMHGALFEPLNGLCVWGLAWVKSCNQYRLSLLTGMSLSIFNHEFYINCRGLVVGRMGIGTVLLRIPVVVYE